MHHDHGMATTRRTFLGGAAALALSGRAETVADWKPAQPWRGFNLLGMFRCPTTGLAPDPRVDGHFVEWEFKALHRIPDGHKLNRKMLELLIRY